ncbi:slr1306 family protein [Roseofilum casamattae]|uniref:DUF697 domain-containing protein n=1 Tax=Roseofilum casamattae BLCC-M143 TaxID=3022442 RepID=A0ABT7BVM4_9CYAN|nr:DUF697 domain-containing protein [Roseofilum casamattae]MDJ1183235.1 DUF697 domain-containing protein [Roseofilum casamattae BLCC-M143]
MTALIRRPLLVGGVGLGALLWLWTNLETSVADWGEWITWLAIAGGGVWWWRQKRQDGTVTSPVVPASQETVEKALARVEIAIADLAAENRDISSWERRLSALRAELTRQTLQLAITGGKSTGKTTLASLLGDRWNVVETPALFTPQPTEDVTEEIARKLTESDIVLFVISGDLTNSEYQTLQQLREARDRVVLVLNKTDRYLPQDLPSIREQLRDRISGQLQGMPMVEISAAPQEIKVRKHQADGMTKEWMETPAPQLQSLNECLGKLSKTSNSAILATVYRKAQQLQGDIRDEWNQIRRDRALPIIEQYQWIAAVTAFANPIPSLDLLTTGAITGQLILDIAKIYQSQPSFTLQHGTNAAGTIAELMVKLGFVELSTQTITGILKTNAITYTAGGLVQGISAAYLTRIAGLSLIEYWQTQEVNSESEFNLDKLSTILKRVFQQNQRAAFIQSFVTATANKLRAQTGDNQPSAIAS